MNSTNLSGRLSVPFGEAVQKKQYKWERFADQIKIGSLVYCHMHRVQKDCMKLGARRMIVQAIWRDRYNDIKKLEMLNLTTNIKRIYPSDFYIQNDKLKSLFRSDREGRLDTSSLSIVDFNDHFVNTGALVKHIDESLWPGIAVRRVHALIYSPTSHVFGSIPDNEGLHREGITFPTIPSSAIRSGRIAPDILESGNFERIPASVLSQEEVAVIERYAAAYSALVIPVCGPRFNFRARSAWDLDLPFDEYPDWGLRNVKPAAQPKMSADLT